MVVMSVPDPVRPLHRLHAILLGFPLPLFLGALLSDLAYWSTAEVQWINFSQWLNAGGLFAGALVLLWALVMLFRGRSARKGRPVVYFVLLLATWVVGFVSALVHAKDAWATMPEGIYLAALTAALAGVAAWVGYSGFRPGEVR